MVKPIDVTFYVLPVLFNRLRPRMPADSDVPNGRRLQMWESLSNYFGYGQTPPADLNGRIELPTIADPLQGAVQGVAIDALDINPIVPVEQPPLQDQVDQAAKKALKNTKVASSYTMPGTILSGIKMIPKGAFSIIPFIFFLFYTSKEKHLHNVNVKFQATATPKKVRVELGQKDGDKLGITLRIEAGKPVEFIYEGHAEGDETRIPMSFFKPRSVFSTSEGSSYFPFLAPAKVFHWKRQEPHTECMIIVDDPGNPDLKDGPKIINIPLSQYEGFNVVMRDPNLHIDPSTGTHQHGEYQSVEGSEWTTLSSANVAITDPISMAKEHRTQTFPIPFTDGLGKPTHFELKVTQGF